MVGVDTVVRIVGVPGKELEVAGDVGGEAGLAVEPELLLVLALVHGAADNAVVSGHTLHSTGVGVPFDRDGEAGIGDWEECREEDEEEVELHSGVGVVSLEGVDGW